MSTDEKPEHLTLLGARLLELRRARQISQERMSEEIGVSTGTYASWERAEASPRFEQLLMLADCHSTSIDYLVGRAGSEPRPLSARGVTWRLAWSRPSTESEQGAQIWERLIRGETRAQITYDRRMSNADLERRVQDLVLSGYLNVSDVHRNGALETELRQRFTDGEGAPLLRDVWLADLAHIEWDFVRYVLLGHLAKEHFRQAVRPGNSVGLCGGFAVSRMIYALQRGECPGGIRVFPVSVTPVFEKAAVSANSVVSALAYRHFDFGVQASELPFAFEDTLENEHSPPQRIARRILDDAARVDFVFMGIGGRETGALAKDITDLQRDYQWLARVDLQEIQEQGQPVGDILYHLIDATGEPLRGFKEQNEKLVCSIGLSGLRQLVEAGKRVVVIASGPEKADVTRAAITGGYANVIIGDDGLARALLRPGPRG